MIELLLIGAGGHCRSVIDVIDATGHYSIRGIIERDGVESTVFDDLPIVGTDSDLPRLIRPASCAFITVGQIKTSCPRRRLFERLTELGAVHPVIVSPTAHVSRRSHLGAGTVVMHGAVVNAAASIGLNAIVNSLSLVEHDATIGDHCHVATGALVNGGACVEDDCFIGSGAVVLPGVRIGARSVVGAGCVVRRDLPADSLMRGRE